ncbi:MAG: hypothetical protein OFPII_37570 [Osedax symbiont Rs1]|nr:MAG: hypothetical protein OFPII_37570 [Osedax symbiont Rs1]
MVKTSASRLNLTADFTAKNTSQKKAQLSDELGFFVSGRLSVCG